MIDKSPGSKEIIHLYLLFLISVVVIYKLPTIAGTIFQILLLIAFFFSKKYYFWLAFVFLIASEPGFLFAAFDAAHSFSILPNTPFGNLYFSLVFLIVALVKYYPIKMRPSFFLKINILLIFSYLFIQLIAFGVYKITGFIRLSLPWLLLFIVPRMLKQEEDVVKFFQMVFSLVFFVLLTQFYKILTGAEFSVLLGGFTSEVVEARGGIEEVETALRPVYGIFIPFLAIWGSIYFLALQKTYFTKQYLNIIMGLSVFSIFLTATRSWLIASVFMVAFYIIIASRRMVKTLLQVALASALIITIVRILPFLEKQVELSLVRYETLEYFVQGDITASGTVKRFDVRIKRPMAGFAANPILGWGVGKEYSQYGDGHVGYHNLLMSAGLIGFTFWMLLWLNFIRKMLEAYRRFCEKHPYKYIPLVLIAFAGSILIIHTSAQWFGYLIGFNNALAIALLFTLGHRIYYLERKAVKAQLIPSHTKARFQTS